jgi:hypothetical protein
MVSRNDDYTPEVEAFVLAHSLVERRATASGATGWLRVGIARLLDRVHNGFGHASWSDDLGGQKKHQKHQTAYDYRDALDLSKRQQRDLEAIETAVAGRTDTVPALVERGLAAVLKKNADAERRAELLELVRELLRTNGIDLEAIGVVTTPQMFESGAMRSQLGKALATAPVIHRAIKQKLAGDDVALRRHWADILGGDVPDVRKAIDAEAKRIMALAERGEMEQVRAIEVDARTNYEKMVGPGALSPEVGTEISTEAPGPKPGMVRLEVVIAAAERLPEQPGEDKK